MNKGIILSYIYKKNKKKQSNEIYLRKSKSASLDDYYSIKVVFLMKRNSLSCLPILTFFNSAGKV